MGGGEGERGGMGRGEEIVYHYTTSLIILIHIIYTIIKRSYYNYVNFNKVAQYHHYILLIIT